MSNQQILTHGFAAVTSSTRSRAEQPRTSTERSSVVATASRAADNVRTAVRTARSWITFWATAL